MALSDSVRSCLSSCSYIKPQPVEVNAGRIFVVYHLVPTSNHNSPCSRYSVFPLFIILFLHQTTTPQHQRSIHCWLFIILFLHQTTTLCSEWCFWHMLFIILFLHQTTTAQFIVLFRSSCLSSCSYIKPQPSNVFKYEDSVVYHLVPTSNHNLAKASFYCLCVVYHLVPTSNHNIRR